MLAIPATTRVMSWSTAPGRPHTDDCIYFLEHFCIFLQPMRIFSNPPPPIFLQLFLSYAVRSAFFTPHTCMPFRAIETFLPTGPPGPPLHPARPPPGRVGPQPYPPPQPPGPANSAALAAQSAACNPPVSPGLRA